MHVLILFRYFWPESRVAEEPHMLREVVKMHLDRGDTVRVVCGSADDCRQRWAEEFPEGVQFTWFRAAIDREGSMWRRAVNSARLLALGVSAVLKPSPLGVVYLFAYPPGFAGAIIAICRLVRRGTHTIFSFQDNLEYRIPGSVLRTLYRTYNRFCLRRATRTVVLSDEMRAHLLDSFSNRDRESVAGRIEVLNNFYAEDVPPVVGGRATAYDIIYAGNHGPGQNLAYFLRVVARCRPAVPPRIVFYGNGTEKPALMRLAVDLGAKVEFREPIDRRRIADEIRRARFGLVAMRADLPKYAFPSKIAAYTCNGTQVLVMSDPDGALGRWISHEGLGATLDPHDEARAANSLEKLLATAAAHSPTEVAERAQTLFGKNAFLSRLGAIVDQTTASDSTCSQSGCRLTPP
jgi:hypothetical protein